MGISRWKIGRDRDGCSATTKMATTTNPIIERPARTRALDGPRPRAGANILRGTIGSTAAAQNGTRATAQKMMNRSANSARGVITRKSARSAIGRRFQSQMIAIVEMISTFQKSENKSTMLASQGGIHSVMPSTSRLMRVLTRAISNTPTPIGVANWQNAASATNPRPLAVRRRPRLGAASAARARTPSETEGWIFCQTTNRHGIAISLAPYGSVERARASIAAKPKRPQHWSRGSAFDATTMMLKAMIMATAELNAEASSRRQVTAARIREPTSAM
ncbi:MAG: hypothetical protein ACLQGP_08495 [Isosphaeraceae bacterium]